MGFNTAVLILNDRLDEIQRDPERFVSQLFAAIQSFEEQDILGQTTVLPTAHADFARIYFSQGNWMCDLLTPVEKIPTRLHRHYEERLKDAEERVRRQRRDLLAFRMQKQKERDES